MKASAVVVGARIGRWTIVAPRKPGELYVQCRCDCGAEASVNYSNLGRHSWSCGCWSRQASSVAHTTHGATDTPTYRSWRNMKSRCTQRSATQYPLYGGRGITICDRWMSFENFLADMGERPPGQTLDRINPDSGYEPENCRWATPAEQAANRRRSGPPPTAACRNGHAWTTENTRTSRSGSRRCRTCERDAARRRATTRSGGKP